MRHDSSQSSSSGTSNLTASFRSRTSVLSSTQATTNTEISSKSTPSKRGENENGRKTLLPQRQATSHETPSEDGISEDCTQEPERNADAQLVDPDFRSKFVEKGRSARQPSISVPLLREKGPEAAVAAASYQAPGNLELGPQTRQDGKGEAAGGFFSEISPVKGLSRQVAESMGDEQTLPRTKSQLTLLLKKDEEAKGETKRAQRGGQRR